MYHIGPFVKWAGGKKQLLDRLRERIPSDYVRYFEPFIGGGALLLGVQPQNAVINDVNPQLLNVYRQLKANADAVICKIQALALRRKILRLYGSHERRYPVRDTRRFFVFLGRGRIAKP